VIRPHPLPHPKWTVQIEDVEEEFAGHHERVGLADRGALALHEVQLASGMAWLKQWV
jgi:hypothetical protein